LWVDGSGHLHLLSYTGADTTVIDSSNIGAQTLGGDLYGSIAAGHVGLHNNSPISAYDTSGTIHPLLELDTGNSVLLWNAGGNVIRWVNQANSAQLGQIDNSGNMTINTGSLSVANGTFSLNGAGQWLYFIDGNSRMLVDSSRNMYWDTYNASWYWRDTNRSNANAMTLSPVGNLNVLGVLDVRGTYINSGGGYYYFVNNTGINWNWDGTYIRTPNRVAIDQGLTVDNSSSNNGGGLMPYGLNLGNGSGEGISSQRQSGGNNQFGIDFWTGNIKRLQITNGGNTQVAGQLLVAGSIALQGVGINYGVTLPNSAATYGQGYANAWINASSKRWKLNVKHLEDSLRIILHPDIHAVSYDHPNYDKDDPDKMIETVPSIGFVAEDWLPHVPEIVSTIDGEVMGMDYARVTALLFEGLKEYITATDLRLEALEKRATSGA
jgi:hypothetical protein